ncbi:MAG TPA: PAS domain-containing protein [Longimicrobiales bacterium]|nr:PAS domain-containing protein [Longimicrobiales bacterium]
MADSARDVVRTLVERVAATTGRAIHAFDRSPPEGELFLRRLLRHLPGMAYRCRNDGAWTMEFVSQGCRALTGFAPEDLIDDAVVAYVDLIHPDDWQAVRDAVDDAVVRGASFGATYRIRRVDGQERRVWEQGSAVVDERGRVTALEGFITDITEQTELAARSALREDQFRALVEQSLVGVYLIREGRFAYANPRLADILGYDVDEITALDSVLDVVHPEDQELVGGNLRRRLEGEVLELRYEFRCRRKDGRDRWVEVHGTRLDLPDGPSVMGTLLDITDRRRRAQRYHEEQKMEALGRLSAGVAHDLNNFLALIRTTAELAMHDRPEDGELARDLSEIMAATERGTLLSRQLMHFARAREGVGAPVSLASILRDMQPGLERMLGPHIELRVAIAEALPDVPLDATYADEIVMNLVLNARDAMPEGGALSITLECREGGTERSPAVHRNAEHVVLEIGDTGVGISRRDMKHIFEPYFTTKGDEGTGLGLANVWRLVSDAGGVVEVDSEEGAGATFRVHLPVLRTSS